MWRWATAYNTSSRGKHDMRVAHSCRSFIISSSRGQIDDLAHHVCNITHSGQVCADELSSVAQALKTFICRWAIDYSFSLQNMRSSCSSRSLPLSYPRTELTRATVSWSVRGVNGWPKSAAVPSVKSQNASGPTPPPFSLPGVSHYYYLM